MASVGTPLSSLATAVGLSMRVLSARPEKARQSYGRWRRWGRGARCRRREGWRSVVDEGDDEEG